MASVIKVDEKLLLINCDCGNIIADAPDAELVQCHDCKRRYRVYGGQVYEETEQIQATATFLRYVERALERAGWPPFPPKWKE